MGSESKVARLTQKESWEVKLQKRISELTERGVSLKAIPKDAAIRKMRAEIRKAVARLQVIEAKGKKIADMAKAKAKKASGAEGKKEKGKKKAEKPAEMSKRQKKKKKKKEEKEVKEKVES
jgi:hypothetical protein